MKRLFAFVLTILILLFPAPVSAGTDEPSLEKDGEGYYLINTYAEFRNHLLWAQGRWEHFYYRLNCDVSQTDNYNDFFLYINSIEVTLDLNGHTLERAANTADNAMIRIGNRAAVTVLDSDPRQTGAIVFKPHAENRNPRVISVSNSDLTVLGGNIVLAPRSAGVPAVLAIEGGTTRIYGGTFDGTRDNPPTTASRWTLPGSPPPPTPQGCISTAADSSTTG